MSDISALSHDYEASSKLAEELNDAILAIKRARIGPRPGLGVGERKALAKTLASLWRQMDRRSEESSADDEYIPQEVVERLAKRHRAKLAYFLEDIWRTSSVLESETLPIDNVVVQTLDQICAAADATASSVSRAHAQALMGHLLEPLLHDLAERLLFLDEEIAKLVLPPEAEPCRRKICERIQHGRERIAETLRDPDSTRLEFSEEFLLQVQAAVRICPASRGGPLFLP